MMKFPDEKYYETVSHIDTTHLIRRPGGIGKLTKLNIMGDNLGFYSVDARLSHSWERHLQAILSERAKG